MGYCTASNNFRGRAVRVRLTMLVQGKGRVNRNRNGCRSISLPTYVSAKVSKDCGRRSIGQCSASNAVAP